MLPSVLRRDDWLRPRPTVTQLRTDVLVGAVLTVVSSLSVELLRATPGSQDISDRLAESHVWAVLAVAPLMVRRRFPLTVMLLCSFAFYLTGERVQLLGYSVAIQVALFVSIYTAWAWSRRPRTLFVSSALVVLGMFAWLIELMVTASYPAEVDAPGLFPPAVAIAVFTLGVNVVYFFGAIAWGMAAYHSAHQRELLEQQAAELRRERDLKARRAVADERLRIARDLHDVVAHHVTAVGVQAAAARHVLVRDPTSSKAALAAIEESSRSAVAEMHRLVGLLRTDDPGGAGSPALSDLQSLAASESTPGLRVGYQEVGTPVEVPDTVARSAYRIVQEALTNVRRHSTARRADVVLRYLDGFAIEVEVVDDGSPRPGHAGADAGAGYGLQGIRERVALHGGEDEIGPRPDSGFRVRARLPLSAPDLGRRT